MAKKKAKSKQRPIVLRFEPMFPHQFARYLLHEERKGRGSKHCDPDRKLLNRKNLLGEENWQELFDLDLAAAKAKNFAQEMDALEKLGRKKDRAARGDKWLVDPWRASQKGPLREVIITAHHKWFEATDENAVDGDALFTSAQTQREDDFVDTAIAWLETRFGDAVITARADFDEEAPHIHAIIAPWIVQTSERRGTQRLLVPNRHALLASYEAAQTDIAAFFAPLGLVRGKERAKARREAEAAGKKKPKKAWHTPPRIYRWLEAEKQRKKAKKLKKLLRKQKREHKAQMAELEALRAELDGQRNDQAEKQRTLETREKVLDVREIESECRKRGVEQAEAILEAAADGTVVDVDQGADEPALVKRVRRKLADAFAATRTAAVAAAKPEIDRQMAIAQHLANKARAFRDALEHAVSRTVLPVILRRIEGEEREFSAAETAAQTSDVLPAKARPGDEIGGD